MFNVFTENELISHNQSGFKAGEYHSRYLSIYQSLDAGLQTRGVFLDISEAFDKVWH